MFKVGHRTLIIVSGLVWLLVGLFLLTLGLKFIFTSTHELQKYGPSLELSLATLITTALLLGTLKGRFVLGRSAKRQIRRIFTLSAPVPIQKIYTLPYYCLLGGMMGLGFLMRVLPISTMTRGAVDVAIGAALINGAFIYFRHINFRIEPL